MKDHFYIIIIVMLTALSVFLFLSNRKAGGSCENMGPGMRGRGMGMGMGAQSQAARDTLFGLIKTGSTDTLLIFSKLEGVIDVQRENQKSAVRRILFLRDSLTGKDREAFLTQINNRFCQGQGMRRHGRGRE